MKPMPGSWTAPRLSISLSSWRISSPTRSGRWLIAHVGAPSRGAWRAIKACPAMHPQRLREEIDFRSRDQARLDAFNLVGHRRQLALDVLPGGRNRDDAKSGTLPQVVMLDLGDRDVELLQTVLDRSQDHPLVLQGLRVRDVQLDGKQRDDHNSIRDS